MGGLVLPYGYPTNTVGAQTHYGGELIDCEVAIISKTCNAVLLYKDKEQEKLEAKKWPVPTNLPTLSNNNIKKESQKNWGQSTLNRGKDE